MQVITTSRPAWITSLTGLELGQFRKLVGLVAKRGGNEVAHIREASYSINRGESEAGVLAMGIACSVPEADLLAGLAVSGPDGTFRGAWEAETAHRLRMAADTLIRQVTTHSF